MGLFDKIGGAIGGALEGLGNAATAVFSTPIIGEALAARLGEKLGPRGSAPGTVAAPPQIFAVPQRLPQTTFGGTAPSASSIFNPGGLGRLAGAEMAQNPFGSGPFLPPAAGGFQTANMLGPVVRQLPGLLGGLAAGEAVETLFAGRAMSAKMPGGITVNSLFRQTPTGRMSPSRVAFMEDGQGGGAFFVNAGVPKTWSKVTMKKRRACHPR